MNRYYLGYPYFSPLMLWTNLAMKTLEMMLASAQVVGHRTGRMALAGPAPSARDRREFPSMGQEKIEAGAHSAQAMAAQMMSISPPWGALGRPPNAAELGGADVAGEQPNAKRADRAASGPRARAGAIGKQHGTRFGQRRKDRASRSEADSRQGHRERQAARKALTADSAGTRAAGDPPATLERALRSG